jgi:hypothetical protein
MRPGQRQSCWVRKWRLTGDVNSSGRADSTDVVIVRGETVWTPTESDLPIGREGERSHRSTNVTTTRDQTVTRRPRAEEPASWKELISGGWQHCYLQIICGPILRFLDGAGDQFLFDLRIVSTMVKVTRTHRRYFAIAASLAPTKKT